MNHLSCQHQNLHCTNVMLHTYHRHQSWEGWGCDPLDFGMGVVESPWNIIISYNVQEYEIKKLSKVVNRKICVYKVKIPGMIPSILCYVPLSVELLELTNPSF